MWSAARTPFLLLAYQSPAETGGFESNKNMKRTAREYWTTLMSE